MTVKIKNFDHDITIQHIGGLFKGSKSQIWSINLQCSPKQEKGFTNFSNAAMLIRGKRLNCNQRQLSQPNLITTLTKDDIITPSYLKDFNELATDSRLEYIEGIQNSFLIERPNEAKIHLPQFELARTLFLINSYFCRASLSTTTIQHEFELVQNDEETIIYFLDMNTMPLKLVKQKATQGLLAWLLLDPNAKQSFESICRNFNTQLKDENGWKKWIFQFDPPQMVGWKLHFRGRYNQSKDDFFVEEIVGIEIDSDMPTQITFNHLSFIQTKTEGNQSGSGYRQGNTSEPQIDDGRTASNEQGTRILDGNESWVSFIKPLEIKKEGKIRIIKKVKPDGSEDDDPDSGHVVSTDEANSAGDLPAADVGGKKDFTNYDQMYAQRYSDFNEMIASLQQNFDCELYESITHELMQVGRSECHMIGNNKYRTIKFVHLGYEGDDFLLIELDTSDDIKSISTKLIYLTLDDWKVYLDKIKQHLVSKSLSWPNALFDDVFGPNSHTSINHPRASSEQENSESVNHWAERVINGFKDLI